MKRLFLILFYAVIISSCSNLSEDANYDESLNNGELIIYDSIDLPESKFSHITDYNPDVNTFIGVFDHKIIGFKSAEITYQFDRYGEGPEEYQYQLPIFVDTKFVTDTSLMINSFNDLKFYSLKGDFLKQARIDENLYYLDRFPQACINDSLVIFVGGNNYPEDPKTPLESLSCSKFFTLNLNSGEYIRYGSLEKENYMLIANKFLLSHDMVSIFNKRKNQMELIFSAKPQLFRYQISDPAKYEYIELTPEFQEEPYLVENSFEVTINNPSFFKIKLRNNSYKEAYSSGDTLITAYQPGINQSLINKELGEGPDATIKPGGYFKFINKFCENYIEYYINGEKQIHDLKVPNHCKVEYIGDSKHILISDPNQELTINNKPLKRYYLCKINKNQL
ncbi:MAG: hypothetical protein ACEPOV_12940 [Hyphomicrobiales bacterium]